MNFKTPLYKRNLVFLFIFKSYLNDNFHHCSSSKLKFANNKFRVSIAYIKSCFSFVFKSNLNDSQRNIHYPTNSRLKYVNNRSRKFPIE